MNDDANDPFEDTNSPAATQEALVGEEATTSNNEDDKAKDDGKTGEDTTVTTPVAGKKDDTGSSSEKMIPESRFKAALKDVTEKLDAANKELSTLKATPIPDKEKDPEGYDLHIRMETSKAVMRETVSDYDAVITHYKKMADANPYLNSVVAAHPAPAKCAYDIAKKALEIDEVLAAKGSDEWKEFQEFKKAKTASSDVQNKEDDKVSKQVTEGLSQKVPNLNRATNVTKSNHKIEDDELFAGAL